MRVLALCFIGLAISLRAYADEPIPPLAAIASHGALTLSDGSSFYTFRKDHSFSSGPLGFGGRTVDGKWRVVARANQSFEVEGRWAWINGLSRGADFRRMVLDLRPGNFRSPTEAEKGGLLSGVKEIFQCYFLIDELTPIPKPSRSPRIAAFPL